MLTVERVDKAYEAVLVLKEINLDVRDGEVICLLGASGSGKSTLLRLIAGLEHPDSGDIRWADRTVLHTPVHQRGFGLMFQDHALFPHLNAAENIRFGLRMQKVPAPHSEKRVKELLQLVGLSGYERRDIATLSGGERQRVALARSLAPQPKLLMLDEPLGALDAALRADLVVELRTIFQRLNQTAIYVTHDQQEAFAIADRVAVLHHGGIARFDAPQRLYLQPSTVYVARFLGLNNILPILERDSSRVRTALGWHNIDPGTPQLLIHPDAVELSRDGVGLSVMVESVDFQGEVTRLVVRTESDVTLEFAVRTRDALGIRQNDTIHVQIDDGRIVPLEN